jgi:anti-sigma B factor antagonist
MTTPSAKVEMEMVRPGCLLVRCGGGLGWDDRAQLADAVERELRDQRTVQGVVVDFSAVEFVNSAGIGALFQLNQRLRERGAGLACACAPAAIVRLFHLAGLSRIACICDDVESGLQYLAAAGGPLSERIESAPRSAVRRPVGMSGPVV